MMRWYTAMTDKWYEKAVFYQIYPLGLTGALGADDTPCSRINKIYDWIPHIKDLGCNAVYFSPVFDSDYHGYDTRSFEKIDRRLGTDEDFAKLVKAFHDAGIRVIIDGVFNHVGRNFLQFADVREKKQDSAYKDWFNIDFGGSDGYGDGFYYEGWEGHYELVKLNLYNNAVRDYLFSCIRSWVEKYDIDGLRLDVAYCLPKQFLYDLRSFTGGLKDDFYLLGEVLGGDYKNIYGPGLCDSATNYECCKGIYSSLNSYNMFEIGYSLNRQFGNDPWTLYRGSHLLSFADNHDVDRIGSLINEPAHLPLVYGLLFTMPGIPCIYYGSEWGIKGTKQNGDEGIRPELAGPEKNELSDLISKLAVIHKNSDALVSGSYRQILLTNRQFIFERKTDSERILAAFNIDGNAFHADFDAGCGRADELITGTDHDFGGGSDLPPFSVSIFRCEY